MLKQHSLKIPFRFHDYNHSGPCCFCTVCLHNKVSCLTWPSLISKPCDAWKRGYLANQVKFVSHYRIRLADHRWATICKHTLYCTHCPVSHKAIFHHRHKQKALGYYVAERSLLSYLEVAEIGNMCPTAHVRINTWGWTRLVSTTLINTQEKLLPKIKYSTSWKRSKKTIHPQSHTRNVWDGTEDG